MAILDAVALPAVGKARLRRSLLGQRDRQRLPAKVASPHLRQAPAHLRRLPATQLALELRLATQLPPVTWHHAIQT